ncbi:MAG: protein SCO1/2 [Pirellulaceae bacterium]|jgi:protein SCO1/2
MKKALGLGLAFFLLFGGVLAIWAAVKLSQKPEFEEVLDPFASLEQIPGIDDPWLKRYTLIKRSGKPFQSEELAGKVHVTCFFYAACPASCWKQNLAMKSLQKDFPDQDVRFLSITCDPEADTHLALASYAQKLEAKSGWYFLTGDMKYIRRIGAEIYQLPVDKQVHVDVFVATDKWGNLRGRYKWKEPAEMGKIRTDIRTFMAETEAPPPTATSPLPGPTVPPLTDDEDADGDGVADDTQGSGSAATTDEATEGKSTTEGDATEGEAATEGDATEGDATEGDATEGDATEGDATEGDATEGDATEGDGRQEDADEPESVVAPVEAAEEPQS